MFFSLLFLFGWIRRNFISMKDFRVSITKNKTMTQFNCSMIDFLHMFTLILIFQRTFVASDGKIQRNEKFYRWNICFRVFFYFEQIWIVSSPAGETARNSWLIDPPIRPLSAETKINETSRKFSTFNVYLCNILILISWKYVRKLNKLVRKFVEHIVHLDENCKDLKIETNLNRWGKPKANKTFH